MPLLHSLQAALLGWMHTTTLPASHTLLSVRCGQLSSPVAQMEIPPNFNAEDLPDLPEWSTKRSSGARQKRNDVSNYAKSLGAEKGYSNVDDFVKEHVPASGQPGQRRRKKQWDPAKRKPHKRDQRRTSDRKAAKEARGNGAPAPLSHVELLRAAKPALASAAANVGVELVGDLI